MTSAAQTLRAFLAIALPEDLRTSLETLQRELAAGGLDAKWVRAASIHLTIKFLGNIEAARVGSIAEAAREAAAGTPRLELVARGLGTFPHARRPKVLWVGLGGDANHCSALAQRVNAALAPLGVDPDDRPFHPHLTLGRFKGGINRRALRQALERWRDAEIGRLEAEELVLYRSELLPEGARHTALERIPLGT